MQLIAEGRELNHQSHSTLYPRILMLLLREISLLPMESGLRDNYEMWHDQWRGIQCWIIH